jgi:hypothetical protein
MLNKEELAAFLALLLAFATASGLSGTRIAMLFGTSVPTMARWLRVAREGGSTTSAYRYMADPVRAGINVLNDRDEALRAAHGVGMYAGAAALHPRVRTNTFKGVLDGRVS